MVTFNVIVNFNNVNDLPDPMPNENLMRIPRKNFPSIDLIYSEYLVQITIASTHSFIINDEIAQLIVSLDLEVAWTILFIVPADILQEFKPQKVEKTKRPVYKTKNDNLNARKSETKRLDKAEKLKEKALLLAKFFPQKVLGLECQSKR